MSNSVNCYEIICVECVKDFFPDIHLCRNDHIVCPKCRKLLKNCPTCGFPPSVHIPSSFCNPYVYNEGDLLTLTAIKEHEDDCEFGPYKCPVPYLSCEFYGSIDEIERHLHQHHGVPIQLSTTTELVLEEDPFVKISYLDIIFHFESHKIYLVLEKCRSSFGTLIYNASLQLIGARKIARTLSSLNWIRYDTVSKATISSVQSIRDPCRRVPDGNLIFDAREIEDIDSNGREVVRFLRFRTSIYEKQSY